MGKCYGSGWQTVQEYTIYHKQCYLSNTTHLHIVHGWHFNINLHKNTFAVDTLQCASEKCMHQNWVTICVKKCESIGKMLYNIFPVLQKIPLSVNEIYFSDKMSFMIVNATNYSVNDSLRLNTGTLWPHTLIFLFICRNALRLCLCLWKCFDVQYGIQ